MDEFFLSSAGELVLFIVVIVLDLWLRDPHDWPHPVRFLGWCAHGLEGLARKTSLPLRLSGLICTAVLVLLAGGISYALLCLPLVGSICWVYLGYTGLALGSLLGEAALVHSLLARGELQEARHRLSLLVSRDTQHMTTEEVAKGLAETVSENLCDGFVAPFFYFVLGGPVFLWAYKAASTLDSMWGYKTPEYKDFGWAAARLDDLLAFVPARLTALAFVLVGSLQGMYVPGLRDRIGQDARKSASPNAGWPMAAAAWLVGASMGGRAQYFGKAVDKPVLGPYGQSWDISRCALLNRLTLHAGLLAAFVLLSGKIFFVLVS